MRECVFQTGDEEIQGSVIRPHEESTSHEAAVNDVDLGDDDMDFDKAEQDELTGSPAVPQLLYDVGNGMFRTSDGSVIRLITLVYYSFSTLGNSNSNQSSHAFWKVVEFLLENLQDLESHGK